jgi:hypothetical protein
MAYAQIQELEESKLEIQRLREQMTLGSPIVHKDLSLISLIPMWSGSESANSFRRIHFNLRNFSANWAMGTERYS